MNTHRLARLTGVIAPLLVLAAASRADAVCDLFQTLPDGRIRGPFAISTGTNDVGMRFLGSAGKSYSVEGLVISAPYNAGTLSANWGGAGVNCPTLNIGGLRRTDGFDPAPEATPVGYVRASFTAAATGVYMLRLGNTSGTPVSVEVSVTETTQYSPAWTTNGSFDTYYSFLNTTRTACGATLTLYNTSATAVTTMPLNVPAGATASVNTVTMGTPRNTTGTAKLTHDCPPGAFLPEAAIASFSISPPYVQLVHFEGTREASTH